MAHVGQDEVEVQPGEVLVERRIKPAQRDRTGPLGLLVVVAFVLTCVLVFFGERLGLRAPDAPQSTAENVAPSAVH